MMKFFIKDEYMESIDLTSIQSKLNKIKVTKSSHLLKQIVNHLIVNKDKKHINTNLLGHMMLVLSIILPTELVFLHKQEIFKFIVFMVGCSAIIPFILSILCGIKTCLMDVNHDFCLSNYQEEIDNFSKNEMIEFFNLLGHLFISEEAKKSINQLIDDYLNREFDVNDLLKLIKLENKIVSKTMKDKNDNAFKKQINLNNSLLYKI